MSKASLRASLKWSSTAVENPLQRSASTVRNVTFDPNRAADRPTLLSVASELAISVESAARELVTFALIRGYSAVPGSTNSLATPRYAAPDLRKQIRQKWPFGGRRGGRCRRKTIFLAIRLVDPLLGEQQIDGDIARPYAGP